MQKIFLVTGAAGFIGGAIAKRLLELGHQVVTIDNLSTGYEDAIPNGVKFYKGDCQDINVVTKLEKYSFEAIYHIAGQSSGEISFDNPVYDLQTNTQSTLLLLQLALKTKCKKFIYASTMSVYGDQEVLPVREDAPTTPISFYGVGKLASENYLSIYQNYGINCTALRLFNVYGPGQNMKNLRQGMVSIFMAMALNDKKIHVKGHPDRYRDFVYITDVVEAFIKAYIRKSEKFIVVNIATSVKTTVDELNNIILSNLPYQVEIKYDGNTPGDQFGIIGDNHAAAEQLNWNPKVDLKLGLEKMVNWAIKR